MRIKPLVFGFITGVVFVFVSTLGLVIGFFEFIRPALSPGTEILRGSAENIPAPLIVGIILNGIIYAALFYAIALTKKFFDGRKRTLAIAVIIIIFLALTGMLSDIFTFIVSPDKAWIFNVGA